MRSRGCQAAPRRIGRALADMSLAALLVWWMFERARQVFRLALADARAFPAFAHVVLSAGAGSSAGIALPFALLAFSFSLGIVARVASRSRGCSSRLGSFSGLFLQSLHCALSDADVFILELCPSAAFVSVVKVVTLGKLGREDKH